MASSDAPVLSADRPERDPERDAFGYAPFAKQLAKSILAAAPEEGLVLGVYAPWGSGKSTMLNFVEHYLALDESAPIVIRFNPWWFSGEESLARTFFDQLEAELASKLKSVGKKIRTKIATFADAVAPVGKVVSIPGGPSGEDFAKVVAAASRGKAKEVVALKQDLSKALAEQEKTILVVVDDVDRLTAEEVRQLFRVIKAVADFPKVFYLLAFDKAVVVRALNAYTGDKGEEYLEKIVQVPFELPLPERPAIHRLLFEKLNRVLIPEPKNFDEPRWTNLFFDGIQGFIQTPRDVVRLANSLSVTYPAVATEVNAVDFIAIEALRVFEPDLYDLVRRNPDQFLGNPYESLRGQSDSAFHEVWKGKLRETRREHVPKLIAALFPRAFRATSYDGGGWDSPWRRERRVASRDAFPAYFRLAIPKGEVSAAEVEAAVAVAGDRARFREVLRSFLPERPDVYPPRIRTLLDRLQDYTEREIPDWAVPDA